MRSGKKTRLKKSRDDENPWDGMEGLSDVRPVSREAQEAAAEPASTPVIRRQAAGRPFLNVVDRYSEAGPPLGFWTGTERPTGVQEGYASAGAPSIKPLDGEDGVRATRADFGPRGHPSDIGSERNQSVVSTHGNWGEEGAIEGFNPEGDPLAPETSRAHILGRIIADAPMSPLAQMAERARNFFRPDGNPLRLREASQLPLDRTAQGAFTTSNERAPWDLGESYRERTEGTPDAAADIAELIQADSIARDITRQRQRGQTYVRPVPPILDVEKFRHNTDFTTNLKEQGMERRSPLQKFKALVSRAESFADLAAIAGNQELSPEWLSILEQRFNEIDNPVQQGAVQEAPLVPSEETSQSFARLLSQASSFSDIEQLVTQWQDRKDSIPDFDQLILQKMESLPEEETQNDQAVEPPSDLGDDPWAGMDVVNATPLNLPTRRMPDVQSPPPDEGSWEDTDAVDAPPLNLPARSVQSPPPDDNPWAGMNVGDAPPLNLPARRQGTPNREQSPSAGLSSATRPLTPRETESLARYRAGVAETRARMRANLSRQAIAADPDRHMIIPDEIEDTTVSPPVPLTRRPVAQRVSQPPAPIVQPPDNSGGDSFPPEEEGITWEYDDDGNPQRYQ